MTPLRWNPVGLSTQLVTALRTLAEEYPLHETNQPGGFRPAGATLTTQLRSVGSALAKIPARSETVSFTTFGVMLDCSRNAVMRPEHLKRWLRRLALLGFNQVMLYTEDTYEISGEPRFGFQRGRYTRAELRDLDLYADQLGIELVGCIQTLAHLEQILRWPEYQAVKDYDSVLLVGEPQTYALIGKMLDAMSSAIRSRRIHVGMDEAWALGRGAYLDRHGARRKFDIFNEHLARVVALCRERNLKPMIWSDMFFAMGSPTHQYYDPGVIPPDVVAAIPRAVQLVYWDYYHADVEFYRDYIARHRALHHEPIVASGVWTWSQLWYNHRLTEAHAGACLEACRQEGVQEVFFTLWGDDGAYCDFDSALAGLAWVAERAYASDVTQLPARFRSVCGADYAAVVAASAITEGGPVAFLWDDPILGILANEGLPEQPWPVLPDWSADPGPSAAGDLAHARLLAEVLKRKLDLRMRLVTAYDQRDEAGLRAVAADAGKVASLFEDLEVSWRRGWMRRNKPQGYEVIQLRLAQQAMRHRELARRVEELITGHVSAIPELEDRPRQARSLPAHWRFLASGSVAL